MKKINSKTLIPALALAVAVPAVALPQFRVNKPGESRLISRQKSAPMRIKGKKQMPVSRTIGWGGDEIANVEKYGTLELRLEEDFSLLTSGSEEAPDLKTDMTIPDKSPDFTYPWWNFDPKYTHEPHWGTGAEDGSYASPAGGCFYMEINEDERGYVPQAHINTPLIKLDDYDATAVLEFRARTKNAGETFDWLMIEAGETYNMGPTWDVVDEATMVTGIPSEWTTYRLIFRGAGPTTLFNIVAVGPGNVYIDDLKVYQLKPHIEYPQVTEHSDYAATSFTAKWKAVEGAEHYLLNVWSQPEGEPKPIYLLKDQKVTGNSYKVEGTVSGETYWYTLRACKGDFVSLESFSWRVYDLEVPVMLPSEITGPDSYTANWNTVPFGDVYNYRAYGKRVAANDGPFVVTNEDFTGILDGDGVNNGLTKEDVAENNEDIDTYEAYYSNEVNQQGWYGTCCFPFDGYLCLDGFFWVYRGEQAGYISPEFDMSADGGKFTIEADVAGASANVWVDDDTQEVRTTQVLAVLFTWNDEKGDYDQVEAIEPSTPVKFDWTHYTFNFTKGTDRSVIGLFAVYSPTYLYIDNLKVTQNYPAGKVFMDPFRFKRYNGGFEGETANTIDIIVPKHILGSEVYHQVSAFGRKAIQQGMSTYYDDREGDYCDLEFVMKTEDSGVDGIADDAAGRAYTDGASLIVENPDGMQVNVCTADGKSVYAGRAASVTLTPGAGVYVVRIGDRSMKLAL